MYLLKNSYYYLVSRLGRTFSGSIDLGMLGMRGVVLRPSLFTYSYDLPKASPWQCAWI